MTAMKSRRSRWLASIPGICFAAIGIGIEAVSIAMNHEFATSWAHGSAWVGLLFGVGSVMVDLVKFFLFGELHQLFREGRRIEGLLYSGAWVLTLLFGLMAAAGFANTHFGDTIAGRSKTVDQTAGAKEDLAAKRIELRVLPTAKPVASVQTSLQEALNLVSRPVKDATRDCQEATLPASREACKAVPPLREALAVAQRREKLEVEIAALEKRRDQGADVGSADPQAEGVSRALAGALTSEQVALVRFWLFVSFPLLGPLMFARARERLAAVWCDEVTMSQPAPAVPAVTDVTVTPPPSVTQQPAPAKKSRQSKKLLDSHTAPESDKATSSQSPAAARKAVSRARKKAEEEERRRQLQEQIRVAAESGQLIQLPPPATAGGKDG